MDWGKMPAIESQHLTAMELNMKALLELILAGATAALLLSSGSEAQNSSPARIIPADDRALAHAVYKELIEYKTTTQEQNNTLAVVRH